MNAFAQTEKLATSYNAFGLKLLAQTRQASPDKNIFLSPVGAAFALSMAADGARGETLREIRTALQLDDTTDLNQANGALLGHLTALDAKLVKLEIANSLWIAKSAELKDTYIEHARQFYQAEAAGVDFQDPATVKRINGWVSEHTHGKIPTMVAAPLDPERTLRLILLDAIYFKADWAKPFDKKLTHDAPFALKNGQTAKLPMMKQAGKMDYHEEDSFQEVRLPYAGKSVSMYVFLPKTGMDDFLKSLTPENWTKWSRPLSREGTLELPRFKLENEYNLKGPLAALGMPVVFTTRADFSGITDEPLYISWVKQKTYVDVNEEGTEAAAVTGIGFRALAMRREEPPFHMVVDKPFFMAICDNQTGTMLFAGVIMDPRH